MSTRLANPGNADPDALAFLKDLFHSFFSHPLEVERALSAERIITGIEDPVGKAASQRILIEYLNGRHADKPTSEK